MEAIAEQVVEKLSNVVVVQGSGAGGGGGGGGGDDARRVPSLRVRVHGAPQSVVQKLRDRLARDDLASAGVEVVQQQFDIIASVL